MQGHGVQEPGEIKLMRQAAAIADAAQEKIRDSLYVGINELEIAGIGELEMRRRGSEFHWPVTGSNEIASGGEMLSTTPLELSVLDA